MFDVERDSIVQASKDQRPHRVDPPPAIPLPLPIAPLHRTSFPASRPGLIAICIQIGVSLHQSLPRLCLSLSAPFRFSCALSFRADRGLRTVAAGDSLQASGGPTAGMAWCVPGGSEVERELLVGSRRGGVWCGGSGRRV